MLRVLRLRLRLQRGGLSDPSSPVAEDDLAAVLHRSRSGDRKALRTLLLSLGPSMLQVIRRILGARHPDVEDALQEATIAFVRALPSFRGECTAMHFGCRIATFTAITTYRRGAGARLESLTDAHVPLDHDGVGSDGGDESLVIHRRDLVRRLLGKLPDEQAEALALHCMAGLTVAELASATAVPRETARSRLRLAKAALRKRIATDAAALELLEDLP